MKRIIIDFYKLSEEHKKLFFSKYPRGHSKKGVIPFKNKNGDIIETLELLTNDTIYLVKLNKMKFNNKESFPDDSVEFLDYETYENIEELLKATDAKSSDYYKSEPEAFVK